jgi:YegS/Rv2252/BmrU family lipid kinase
MRHVFVINPRSFSKKKEMTGVITEIRNCFRFRNPGDLFIYISQFPRDAIGMIRKQLKDTSRDETVRVYAVGGDGILFDSLNGIIGFPNAELAAVPYGKSNDYIRAFGENKHHLFRNIGTLINAGTIPTDLIYYGNNYAINFASIGLESAAVIKMHKLNKTYRKFLNRFPFVYFLMYYLTGLVSIFDQKLIHQYYDINIDGKDCSGNYSTINIANGPCYGGNMCTAPTAVPDDGLLDITLIKSSSTFKLLRKMRKYLYGGKGPPQYIILKRAKKISIRSSKPLLVQLDGEILVDTNITLEIAPEAIKMVTIDGLRYQGRAPFNA